jgi:hypothetical protein
MRTIHLFRALRSPAVLMTVYAGVFIYAGPWFSIGGAPERNVPQVVIVVLLAVLAAFGSRVARAIMIVFGVFGILAVLFGSAYRWSAAPSDRLWQLLCYLVQVGLLVSAPMYERTRPGLGSARFGQGRFLPLPPLWTVLASGGAGLLITLLPVWHFQVLACPAGHGRAAPQAGCLADGAGYPIAYRFHSGIFTMRADNIQWLNIAAPRGIQVSVFAADWAMWTAGVFVVLYLAWLSTSRGYSGPGLGRATESPQPLCP